MSECMKNSKCNNVYIQRQYKPSKRYLPILLITPLRLQDILDKVQIAIRETNPDYDIVIKRLYLYYDIK